MASIDNMYAHALSSTNLRDDEQRLSDTDVLKAIAWSNRRFATDLVRLKAHNEYQVFPRLLETWSDYLRRRAIRKNWQNTNCSEIAEKSLQFFVLDVCPKCVGRGKPKIDNAPVLSDLDCDDCNGTGKIDLSKYAEEHIERVSEAVNILQNLYDSVAYLSAKKLFDKL